MITTGCGNNPHPVFVYNIYLTRAIVADILLSIGKIK